jgi:hypothetical protein
MRRRVARTAFVGWLVLCAGWWSWYLDRRAADQRQARAAMRTQQAAWVASVQSLQQAGAVDAAAPRRSGDAGAGRSEAAAPGGVGDTDAATPSIPYAGAAVERTRLMEDVAFLAQPRADEADRKRVRRWLAHRLVALGLQPDLHAFADGVNVVAERPGRSPAAGVVLVGAHYDAVPGTRGADDNATGVAAALEIARIFAERETPGTLRIVLFDAEEQGLLGSRAYAASDARLVGVRAVVVLEMLGFSCSEPGCQRYPHSLPMKPPREVGDFISVVGGLAHVELLRVFVEASRAEGRPPVVALPVPGRGHALPDSRRSDHAPFWDRGVPSVMVTDTADLRSPHYHQPTDTVETLDPAFFAGSTRLVADVVDRLLRATPPPAPPPRSTPRERR